MNMQTFTTTISANDINRIFDESDLRIFDCRFVLSKPDKGRQDFAAGHLPNSQYADLDRQLAGPRTATSGRHPLPDKQQFESQLRKWGVDERTQIVVYDDCGGAIAARLWWMCRWVGLERVALLEGGIQAWEHEGFELTTRDYVFPESQYDAVYDDSLWVSTEEVANLAGKPGILLTDARATPRYRGEVEPIDPVAGHIPGAKNFPFDQNIDDQGLFKEAGQLAQHHQQTPESGQVISMCGSGVTACHNILARAHADLDMGKLYVGSWSEWITDPGRPIG